MKKSRAISLVLITAALASCNKHDPENEWTAGDRHVYMRSDTTAEFSPTYHTHMWYRAFRPIGDNYYGMYTHYGYYSDAIAEHSNYGVNYGKSNVIRGGYGSGHLTVSS